MEYFTELSKSEYIEELKSKTTEGSPTAGPWAIINFLTNSNDKNPFCGKINESNFRLMKNVALTPLVVGIKGQLFEEGEKTRISTKTHYLIFPLILYVIILGSLIIIGIANSIQMDNIVAGFLPIAFGIFIATILSLIYKLQIRQIRRMLTENTSANSC
ncbi:hypothetical protein [Ekhidna sp.]|jgi:hypothetical protein|uniref:hypothetical protein n=1 Tax=Ekhidna sp. TaxID=2608089 RepID=UPI0032EDB185